MKKILIYMAIVLAVITMFSLVARGGNNMKIHVDGGVINGKLMEASEDKLVVLVAGSGPTDMNGNSPLIEGDNDSFLQLAKALKNEGISTFRYDKRTAGGSLKTFEKNQVITFEDFVEDLNCVVRKMKSLGYEKVIILGHSQGSLVGMIAAEENDADGFISLAGSGENIGDTMIKQYMVDEVTYEKHIKLINKLLIGETDPNGEAVDPMFSMTNQEFLLTWMRYDPKKEMEKLDMPVLVIQGQKDLQVKEYDAGLLNDAAKESKLVLIENMNHVLKDVNTDEDNVKSYGDPSYGINRELIEEIKDFVNVI
jgi:hypothetical protein